MKKALLINKGNADNLGDQAIKYVLEEMLKNANFSVDFVDYTFDRTSHNLHFMDQAKNEILKDNTLSLAQKLNRFFLNNSIYKNLMWTFKNRKSLDNINISKDYDLVIIGGGQLILSNSTFPSAIYKWTKYIKKNFQSAKVTIFGVGIGGNFNFYEKYLEKKSLRLIDQIFLRDTKSMAILESELDFSSRYTPDVVFNLSDVKPITVDKTNAVLIGITDYAVYKRYNQNGITKEQYYSQWKDYVVKYLNLNYEVKLFYTSIRDLSESIKFQEYLSESLNLEVSVITVETLDDLIIEIAKAKIIVSGRMHGLIIGYSYGCEVVPYILSEKIESFNEEYIQKSSNLKEIQDNINSAFHQVIEI